ncbi:MAG TPA: hypothetical protein PKD10_16755 [Paracoccaceae bacterium]|nr:hypothetical protein [Paracoccaceae bacterium]HMO70402.1 hypothetical protein [Paracoccaceae bacterium]
MQPDFNLRGVFRTGADGRYRFRGVRPRFPAKPDDGPVGKLPGALGRHPCRPAQLHHVLGAPGHDRPVAHFLVPDDACIPPDAVFGLKEARTRRSSGRMTPPPSFAAA